ncbi:hypothetical protein BDZ85DRAFT_50064 [Elsinoe ampelina]|uniref:Uncharacterized protein n=1 Tax=Elsinoe ampelina TaxID=302913 RepID=A0A6A6GL92_9PEZI|nr:hypothetical protein BDZ85DRAFT_50064 [Elsinoe ampelina]
MMRRKRNSEGEDGVDDDEEEEEEEEEADPEEEDAANPRPRSARPMLPKKLKMGTASKKSTRTKSMARISRTMPRKKEVMKTRKPKTQLRSPVLLLRPRPERARSCQRRMTSRRLRPLSRWHEGTNDTQCCSSRSPCSRYARLSRQKSLVSAMYSRSV